MHLKHLLSVSALGAFALGILSFSVNAEESAKDKGLELLQQAQKICPVSGKKLGEHGAAVKAKSGDRTIFLCCKNCFGKPIDPAHWKTVNANLAKAQKVCPVMNKQLPANAKSTVVKGMIVFVCCPPCINKITADPEKFVKVVNAEYEKNLKESQQ